MKTGTKVIITLGRYRDCQGKVVAKNKARPAPVEGQVAVEFEHEGEKIVIALSTSILKKPS